MTIYDADFVNTGEFVDPAAEGQVAVAQQEPEEKQVDESVHHRAEQESAEEEQVSRQELNFKALRDEIVREKAERESERARHIEEIEFLRNHMSRSQMQNQEQVRQKGVLDDKADDDFLTAGEYRHMMLDAERRHQEELSRVRLDAEEARVRAQHSDYDEVMEKYSIPLLKNNQDFARALNAAERKADFAYTLGKMQMLSQEAKSEVPQREEPKVSQKAERIIENSRKPGTLSNARGGQPSLSKAEYYASMSDAEFASLVKGNLEEV